MEHQGVPRQPIAAGAGRRGMRQDSAVFKKYKGGRFCRSGQGASCASAVQVQAEVLGTARDLHDHGVRQRHGAPQRLEHVCKHPSGDGIHPAHMALVRGCIPRCPSYLGAQGLYMQKEDNVLDALADAESARTKLFLSVPMHISRGRLHPEVAGVRAAEQPSSTGRTRRSSGSSGR